MSFMFTCKDETGCTYTFNSDGSVFTSKGMHEWEVYRGKLCLKYFSTCFNPVDPKVEWEETNLIPVSDFVLGQYLNYVMMKDEASE